MADIDLQIEKQLLFLEQQINGEQSYKKKLERQAYDDLYKQLYKHKLRLQCYNGVADINLQQLYDEVQQQQKIFDDNNMVRENEADYMFININPMEDISIEQIQKVMQKLLSKKWLKDAIYVIEQRGKNESELGKGKHIHLLLHRNGVKPSDIKREIANTIKHICDVETSRKSGWKTGPYVPLMQQTKTLKNRLQYMLGNKKTTDKKTGEYNFKDVKQEMDRLMRKRLQLQDYYLQGNIDISEVQFYTLNATTFYDDE